MTFGQPEDVGEVESARLAAVARYDILDTPPDGAFDRIAALAASLFDVPMATVSIVDADRIWFKAAHGLQGVTQIGRDPGLCASAILQDGPYLVSDAWNDPRAADNPLVQGEANIRFYAGAPITTPDGFRLGTVNVLDTMPRRTSDSELRWLQELASVVADLLGLRLSALTTLRRERALREQAERDRWAIEQYASTLQRTLSPPSLPRIPGLEVHAHYHAASDQQVLGDFYDVFGLGGGRWAFFLGDVEGHGAAAAVVASMARYTLRAAALHHAEPRDALKELNSALLGDRNTKRLCTVLFGVLSPHTEAGWTVTLATGGHPPALWLRRGEDGVDLAEQVRPPTGPLLGTFPDARFGSRQLHLRPEQTLLVYSDGLTEARTGSGFFGEERLARFVAARQGLPAEHLIGDLEKLISEFDVAPADDIALLALHVPTM